MPLLSRSERRCLLLRRYRRWRNQLGSGSVQAAQFAGRTITMSAGELFKEEEEEDAAAATEVAPSEPVRHELN